MIISGFRIRLLGVLLASSLCGCRKPDEVVFDDNTIPPYSGIPTILVENYVNRLFIDLIGREPTDIEMSTEVAALRSGNLEAGVRSALINKLMFSEEFVEGDGSYKEAYFEKLYEDQKARFLNGSSEGTLQDEYGLLVSLAVSDSLQGNLLGYQVLMMEANKVLAIMDSRLDLMNEEITIDEMCRRMMFNSLYDEINMNTFNFINAAFDNTYFRFPTEAEMDACFNTVEANIPGILFGQLINSKYEFLQVVTTSDEFSEGMIRWAYTSLLAREAQTIEVYNLLDDFNNGYNTSEVQRIIMISDEYAGFE